ncbi:MAG: hypothetical protein ABIK28_12405 [Planctomycetota bacterium]
MPARVFSLSSGKPGLSSCLPSIEPLIVAIPCTADRDPYNPLLSCWLGPDEYVYTPLDLQVEPILKTHPKAHLIVKITTCSPEWWDLLHEEEMVFSDDGISSCLLGEGCTKKKVPSLASDLWQETMNLNVRRLVRHIESAPYADHVIGYTASFGHKGSWTRFGTYKGFPWDFNPKMTRRFQKWLTKQYPHAAALSKAWGRSLDFGEALPPAPAEMACVAPTGFRHPVAQRPCIDYLLFLAHLAAETIGSLAATVKESCNDRALFGVPYGNFLDLLKVQNGLQQSSQLGLAHVLRNEQVDFLMAPAGTLPTDPGLSAAFSTAPETSVRLHDKLLFHGWDKSHAPETACTFARQHGLGIWWEEESWNSAPDHAGAAVAEASMQRFFRHAPSFPAGRRKIALVIDDLSMLFIQRVPEQLDALITGQIRELCRAGLAFDTLLVNDLTDSSPYCFLIFPNLFFADRERRESIHRQLRRSRATALWLVAPGFVEEEPLFENIENLTGIRVRKPEHPHNAVVAYDKGAEKMTYGLPDMFAHTPVIEDEECRILGTYLDSDLPGLGVKEQQGWRSIYSGAPAVSADLLYRFAVEAGAVPSRGDLS